MKQSLLNKKLKILMTADDFLPAATGVGVHLQIVSKELVRRGHKVWIITTRRASESDIETWEGVTVYRVTTLKVAGFYQAIPSVKTLEKIMTSIGPDLIHHHYIGFLLKRATQVSLKLSIPQIYTNHMTVDHLTWPFFMRPLRGLITRALNHTLNHCQRILCPSSNLAERVRQSGIRVPVEFISNPLVYESFPSEINRSVVKDSKFTILYVGRLEPEKNIQFLLRGFRRLLDFLPDASLQIIGRGSQESSLKDLSLELKILDRVSFIDFTDHLSLMDYYSNCDVFVLPSLVETQGMVAMEAMFFSKPIIVTNSIVSANELVEHGVNGLIVDSSSDIELATALKDLASDDTLRERMGRSAKIKSAQYGVCGVVDLIEKAYWKTLEDYRPKQL